MRPMIQVSILLSISLIYMPGCLLPTCRYGGGVCAINSPCISQSDFEKVLSDSTSNAEVINYLQQRLDVLYASVFAESMSPKYTIYISAKALGERRFAFVDPFGHVKYGSDITDFNNPFVERNESKQQKDSHVAIWLGGPNISVEGAVQYLCDLASLEYRLEGTRLIIRAKGE